ncbi:MAG: glycosyltransferase [Muribaculaceae bacterium]|nr:glycosyltransferase [Muribaculaceae bacterium]
MTVDQTTPKISIIVAVYNASLYLRRCIDSIKAQTFTDFEVLLLDDESKDNSLQICQETAKNDSRFKVYHNENRGVGSIRHKGIKRATGVYTIHVDPDDWIEPNYLGDLYNKAIEQNADMVISDYYTERKNEQTYIAQRPTSLDNHEIINDLLRNDLHGSTWNKLIKRSCYLDNQINFIEGLNYGEDMVTVVRILQTGCKVAYLPQAYYHYDLYMNDVSYTRVMNKLRIKERVKYISYLQHYVKDKAQQKLVTQKLVQLAYWAIKLDVYKRDEYYKIFKPLKRERIMKVPGSSLQRRLWVWSSFHIGYRFAHVKYSADQLGGKMKRLKGKKK